LSCRRKEGRTWHKSEEEDLWEERDTDRVLVVRHNLKSENVEERKKKKKKKVLFLIHY
jgi:hypothetical protein